MIRNSAIACRCGLAALAPLFGWGAGLRFAPALVYAIAAGCGIALAAVLRRPIVAFLAAARARGRAATVPALVCRQHGDDPRVLALAATLTVGGLGGLLVCEMLALATVLRPLTADSTIATELVVAAALAVVTGCAAAARPAAALHGGGLQLGLMYFGLFGAAALLMYLQMSELGTVPAGGRLAVALIAVCCAVVVTGRRVRYVDTAAMTPAGWDRKRAPAPARAASRLAKILNVLIAVCAGVAIGFAVVELQAAGMTTVVDDGVALVADTPLPGLAAVVFVLWPFLHPIVDAVNWQTLTALEEQRDDGREPQPPGLGGFGRAVAASALEVAVVVLLIALVAAVAGLDAAPERPTVLAGVVAGLVAQDNVVAVTAVLLLVLGLCAMAVATMAALAVACRNTLRHDIVPLLRPRAAPAALEATTAVAAAAAGVAVAVLFRVADAGYGIALASHGFLGLVLASACLQLALAPLVLGPLVFGPLASGPSVFGSAAGGARGSLGPGPALAVMAAGAVTGPGLVCAWAASGHQPWLWAALPVSLASGTAVYGLAWLWQHQDPAAKHKAGRDGAPAQ